MTHSWKPVRQSERVEREERKKDRRGGKAVQGLWCCRASAEWRRICGLKACAGTAAAGQWRKQMWPWFTSAAYQRLLICFNLTAMPHSYFLLLSISLASSTYPDVPTYFCIPPCLGSPLHHHRNRSPPFIILSSSIHTFSLSSDALILSVSYHPPHTHTGMRSVNYLVHPLLHLHSRTLPPPLRF